MPDISFMQIVLIYLLAINLITFLIYGIDKSRAKKERWRVPEKTLILLAVFGGSIGALVGMYLLHHKTRKPKFFLGVPIILILQIATPIAILWLTRK